MSKALIFGGLAIVGLLIVGGQLTGGPGRLLYEKSDKQKNDELYEEAMRSTSKEFLVAAHQTLVGRNAPAGQAQAVVNRIKELGL